MAGQHTGRWRWVLSASLGGWLSLLLLGHSGAQEAIEQLLERVDRVRTPEGSFVMQVTIRTQEPGKPEQVHGYEVFIQGAQQTLVRFTSPAAERGKSLLMLGQDLWAYLPTVGKPIRIPLAQRLVGDVANGDLARLNFAGDYSATLQGSEMFEGQDSAIVHLTAKSKALTYGTIRLWVAKDTAHPLKAEFFTLAGQLLKSGRYTDYALVAGRLRPTRLVMTDHIHAGLVSTLEYRDMQARDIPDKFFNKNYLKHLE